MREAEGVPENTERPGAVQRQAVSKRLSAALGAGPPTAARIRMGKAAGISVDHRKRVPRGTETRDARYMTGRAATERTMKGEGETKSSRDSTKGESNRCGTGPRPTAALNASPLTGATRI
jgi:hypothetical protein